MNLDVTLMGTELEVDYIVIVGYRSPRDCGLQMEPDVEPGIEINRVFIAGTNRGHEVTRLFENRFMNDQLEKKIIEVLSDE